MRSYQPLQKSVMLKAFGLLDNHLTYPVNLLVGGGGALLLAYNFSLLTQDIDALPFRTSLTLGELDNLVKKVAKQLQLNPHWLTSYFASFIYVLPQDYDSRLTEIFKGKYLAVFALGAEDLLILKCFAGREKDISHARFLIKKCKNLSFVENHLKTLVKENVPRAEAALAFLNDLKELLGE